MIKAAKKKKKTNQQLLLDLMKYDVLAELFILDAVYKLANKTSEAKAKDLETPLISGAAWLATAKKIKDALDENTKEA
jgi:hypothetical protein